MPPCQNALSLVSYKRLIKPLVKKLKNLFPCFLAGLLLILAGCSTYAPLDGGPGADVDDEALPPPDVAPPPVRAVDRLVAEARGQYDNGDLDGAIATAERGLRIDRREPRLYYLLAQSYRARSDDYRARQFAQQGLRYADGGSEVAGQLTGLLETLPAP